VIVGRTIGELEKIEKSTFSTESLVIRWLVDQLSPRGADDEQVDVAQRPTSHLDHSFSGEWGVQFFRRVIRVNI
jgi:hypothetical protein